MSNVGCEAYPFVEPATGKKKLVVIARDTKAKTTKQPKWNRRDEDAEDDVGDEVTAKVEDDPAVDNVVEMRRIKRASVEKEIDPFAATRQAMTDNAIEGSYVSPENPITKIVSTTKRGTKRKAKRRS